jgi:hypothetical protein
MRQDAEMNPERRYTFSCRGDDREGGEEWVAGVVCAPFGI